MKKVFLLFVVIALLTSIGFVNAQDDKPITIWIDTTRQAAVDAFVKANPDKASLIKTEIVDRAEFAQKVLLFNNTGTTTLIQATKLTAAAGIASSFGLLSGMMLGWFGWKTRHGFKKDVGGC